MTGSKSALEAMCTLTGGEEKLSGSTLEKAHLVIRTAQRMTHSVRTLATKLTAVPAAEHMHFMIVSAKAVDMLIDSVVTLLVAQSEQALKWHGERHVDGRLAEDMRLARFGLCPGHVKQGCEQHHHLRQAVQTDEGSGMPPMFAGFV